MAEFQLAEKFISINGEGAYAGELAVFLRFAGCNLHCSYCDTQWANQQDTPVTVYTEKEICDYIMQSGARNVTITGGEPLMQENLSVLLKALHALHIRVEVETNGSLPIAPYARMAERPVFTLDYKLPVSGMEDRMLKENYLYLQPQDTVKFVIGTQEDLERAAEITAQYYLDEHCHVYFSPVFGKMNPENIVSFMQKQKLGGVRLQLQLHKIIWDPEKRGV
jgi:7-carboxy-7-deazaguanine synthase